MDSIDKMWRSELVGKRKTKIFETQFHKIRFTHRGTRIEMNLTQIALKNIVKWGNNSLVPYSEGFVKIDMYSVQLFCGDFLRYFDFFCSTKYFI